MQLRLNITLFLALGTTLFLPASLVAQDLAAVEQARQKALAALAPERAARLFTDAEKQLVKAREYAAREKTEAATSSAEKSLALFDSAELAAIQDTITSAAATMIERAIKAKASRYAPVSLQRAESLLAKSRQTLIDDRTATDNAAQLAAAAAATAGLAVQITARARQKLPVEALVLERAGDLWRLQTAAKLTQTADQDSGEAVDALLQEIERLRTAEARLGDDLNDIRTFVAALEEEISMLDERLGGASEERRELVMELAEHARVREQLAEAQSLFSAQEAEVLQQSNVVIVRLIGLQFASGSANFASGSEMLLQKVDKLFDIYPGARVSVEGHTDSKGSDRLNQRLSQNRAQAVMDHIVRDAAIAPERVSAIGYGETRPIANNETAAGRTKNRRIDLIIDP
jgi:outer membrane protein OmpA-like peptidoglycan-associated protein